MRLIDEDLCFPIGGRLGSGSEGTGGGGSFSSLKRRVGAVSGEVRGVVGEVSVWSDKGELRGDVDSIEPERRSS